MPPSARGGRRGRHLVSPPCRATENNCSAPGIPSQECGGIFFKSACPRLAGRTPGILRPARSDENTVCGSASNTGGSPPRQEHGVRVALRNTGGQVCVCRMWAVCVAVYRRRKICNRLLLVSSFQPVTKLFAFNAPARNLTKFYSHTNMDGILREAT